MATSFRTLTLVLALVLTLPGLRPGVDATPAASWAHGDPILDSARAEMAVGRYWHAARLLDPLAVEGGLDAVGLMLLARARAGYRDWAGAGRLLADPAVRDAGGAEAWYLLGRAHEQGGDAAAAAEAYARALADAGTWPELDALVPAARRVRTLWAAGDRPRAWPELDALAHPTVRSWLALEFLEPAVEAGDTAAVGALLERVGRPDIAHVADVADRAWEARARARWQAGDTAGSVAAYREILTREEAGARRATAWLALGRAARSAGDTAAALRAFGEVLAADSRGGPAGPAAAALVDLDGLTATNALDLARVLDRTGDGRRALAAYDRHVALSEAAGRAPDAAARVERARLMATVAERQEGAIREYRALSTNDDAAVGARALELWAGLRRRQGRTNDEATLRRWLVERYPGTVAATDIVFLRGDAAHDRGDLTRALEEYGRVVDMAPALDRAGLSRMRMGQILLRQGRHAEALAVYEGYLADFPQGRRWDEASYWAARIRLATGEAPGVGTGALGLLDRLQAEEPFSYYAVLTADLLERPFVVDDLPPGPDGEGPDWLAQGLAELDLLEAAGLTAAAGHTAASLGQRAREADGRLALYALAEGLNARGRALDGINLGWELRRSGEPWSLRLLRIVYPFPYREMVLREAREWGVDPFLLAGLIRQESAWVADIVSSAGAIGLMQVMPATGRGLARQLGVEGFTEASLETPEVNLHLGARFLVDVLSRYGADLPLALSAYNAGPSRADRWRTFPEAADPLHLTERIPFTETRGYVKNVTRNLRLYEALYGPSVRLAR
jgi:soluble lytic murein transglycosylase